MSEVNEFNRRVVYAGVSRMTTDRNVQQKAFMFWLNKLSSRTFNIKEIVLFFEKYLGLSTGEKKALYVAMQAAVNRPEEALEPVPAFIDGNVDIPDEAPAAPASKAPAFVKAIQAVLSSMANEIHRSNRGQHMELADIVADEGVEGAAGPVNSALKRWGEAELKNLDLPDSMTEPDCQSLFHNFYLLMTEVVGPMATDKYVDQAVVSAMKQPFAADYNPQNLL